MLVLWRERICLKWLVCPRIVSMDRDARSPSFFLRLTWRQQDSHRTFLSLTSFARGRTILPWHFRGKRESKHIILWSELRDHVSFFLFLRFITPSFLCYGTFPVPLSPLFFISPFLSSPHPFPLLLLSALFLSWLHLPSPSPLPSPLPVPPSLSCFTSAFSTPGPAFLASFSPPFYTL